MTESSKPAPPHIDSPADGETLTSNTVSVSGTSDGPSVILYDGEDTLTTAGVTDGKFSSTLSLADGEHALWAVTSGGQEQSDSSNEVNVTVSGQPSPSPSEPQATTVDTPTEQATVTPVPDSPTASSTPGENDTPAQPSTAGTSTAPANTVDSPAPDSAAVSPTVEGSASGTNVEDAQPPAYVPPPPGPGAPNPPSISSPETGADVVGTVVVSGVADNANLVYLEVDGQQFPTAPATASDGAYRFAVQLEPGEHTLATRQRNAAGDVSDPADEVHVTVSAVPEQPSADDPDARLAHFLRHRFLPAGRLSWDLYAEAVLHAEEWLNKRGI